MYKITDLKEIERLFRLITENITDTVWITDLNLKIKYISPSVTKLLGFTLEELQSMPIEQNITPKSCKKVLDTIKKVSFQDIILHSNKPLFVNLELEFYKKDGTTFWEEIVGTLIRNKFEVPQEILFIGRDISQREKGEEELIRLNELNINLLVNSPNPIAVLNADGSVKYLNPSFEKMTGFLLTEVAGIKPPFPWWAKENYKETSEFLKKVLDGTANRSEIYFQTKDGRKIWVLINDSIQKIGDKVQYYIANIIDITDKKNAQDKLEYLSFRDSLTSLYNRAYFDEEIKRLGKSRKIPLSIIIGDANNLKLINDVFGHNKGDELLKKVSKVLQKCCRKEDIISRWGGDEFAIILPDTNLSTVNNIIERIKIACHLESDGKYPVSIALGAAVKETEDDDINIIFKTAEDNMYRKKMIERKSMASSVFSFFVTALFERRLEDEDHTERLKNYINKLGMHLNLSEKQIKELTMLAKFHDIGNIAISEKVLEKTGKLADKDWDAIRRHPEIGCKIAETFTEISSICEYILSHHEYWNGEGYPRKLQGSAIPFMSRIIAIADAYDVMINGTTYKAAVSKSDAIIELEKYAGTQFDPELVEKFIEVVKS